MQGPSFFLEGVWRGVGRVIDNLEYEEEIEFTRIKPDVFSYHEKIKNAEQGPLHSEVGFLRVFKEHDAKEGKGELVVCHPFGVCEVAEGTFNDDNVTLKTISYTETSSAIEPYATKMSRVYKLKDPNTLIYCFEMGGRKSTEEFPKIEGELKRVK